MTQLTVYDIRFELNRFIERQRKVRFIKKLIERTSFRDLRDFERIHVNLYDAENIFIRMIEVGNLQKGWPSREMVGTVIELSRKWAAHLAKFKMEYELYRIRYHYTD